MSLTSWIFNTLRSLWLLRAIAGLVAVVVVVVLLALLGAAVPIRSSFLKYEPVTSPLVVLLELAERLLYS